MDTKAAELAEQLAAIPRDERIKNVGVVRGAAVLDDKQQQDVSELLERARKAPFGIITASAQSEDGSKVCVAPLVNNPVSMACYERMYDALSDDPTHTYTPMPSPICANTEKREEIYVVRPGPQTQCDMTALIVLDDSTTLRIFAYPERLNNTWASAVYGEGDSILMGGKSTARQMHFHAKVRKELEAKQDEASIVFDDLSAGDIVLIPAAMPWKICGATGIVQTIKLEQDMDTGPWWRDCFAHGGWVSSETISVSMNGVPKVADDDKADALAADGLPSWASAAPPPPVAAAKEEEEVGNYVSRAQVLAAYTKTVEMCKHAIQTHGAQDALVEKNTPESLALSKAIDSCKRAGVDIRAEYVNHKGEEAHAYDIAPLTKAMETLSQCVEAMPLPSTPSPSSSSSSSSNEAMEVQEEEAEEEEEEEAEEVEEEEEEEDEGEQDKDDEDGPAGIERKYHLPECFGGSLVWTKPAARATAVCETCNTKPPGNGHFVMIAKTCKTCILEELRDMSLFYTELHTQPYVKENVREDVSKMCAPLAKKATDLASALRDYMPSVAVLDEHKKMTKALKDHAGRLCLQLTDYLLGDEEEDYDPAAAGGDDAYEKDGWLASDDDEIEYESGASSSLEDSSSSLEDEEDEDNNNNKKKKNKTKKKNGTKRSRDEAAHALLTAMYHTPMHGIVDGMLETYIRGTPQDYDAIIAQAESLDKMTSWWTIKRKDTGTKHHNTVYMTQVQCADELVRIKRAYPDVEFEIAEENKKARVE